MGFCVRTGRTGDSRFLFLATTKQTFVARSQHLEVCSKDAAAAISARYGVGFLSSDAALSFAEAVVAVRVSFTVLSQWAFSASPGALHGAREVLSELV